MPIYEYRCECGNEQEEVRSVADRNLPLPCEVCRRQMQRKWSIPCPAVMKPTGRGMALDSLNDRSTSYMKPEHKAIAARG